MKQPCAVVWLAVLAGAALAGADSRACNVPVFRYALERWAPDPYDVVVFHRGPLAAEVRALVETLEKKGDGGLVNVAVTRVDVTGPVPAELRGVWDEPGAALPWLVVRYPRALGIEQPVWSGRLDESGVAALTDSPARRELVRRLAGGDSAVWLLLECGDKARDDAAARLLDEQSRVLEKTLELPDPAPGDPVMNLDRPLKVAFSTLRVALSSPAERVLVDLLIRTSKRPVPAEPIVFAVLGRGRILPPIVGGDITADHLADAAGFITGACSCEAKLSNPGFDLLLAADWDKLIGGRLLPALEPPPLVGLSQFAPAAASGLVVPTKTLPVPQPPDEAAGASVGMGLLGVLSLCAVAAVVGTLVIKGKVIAK
jgi:hypothetical protein